ncbi:hypothetical protein M9458_055248 [Cirrhinus mrigala]|uniref:ribonuclease H n=1 Tax=Cirrhinus mrigala TaxID=683832 RepID=A0ABD0MKH9_CIRMR
MSLRPCASACGSFLASLDGHDHCLTCLGLEHAEAAFTDGSCVHCERMTMAALRYRRSYASRLPSLPSRGKSLNRQGFSATVARHLGDLQVTVQNVPPASKALQTSASLRSPVEWPKQFTSPHAGPSVSFGAPQEVEMSASASEGESEGEADVSAGQRPSAVAAPSEADAKLSAMLLRAAKGIGLEVPKTPPADPSRLDDWFLGRSVPFFPEVHEELVRTWRAPYSSRPRPSSSPLATLDGRAAKGYVAVPQVERAVAVHLCPRGAATWRDRPHLLSRACDVHSSGTGATPMVDPGPDGRRRQSSLSRRSHLPGRPIRRSRSRRRQSNTSSLVATVPPHPRGLNLRLPVAEGAPLQLQKHWLCPPPRHTMPDWWPDETELAAGERRCPHLRDRPGTPAGELRSVPDAGTPEVEEIALWGMTTPTSPIPVEGPGATVRSDAQLYPQFHKKSQFSHLWGFDPEFPFRATPCILGSGLGGRYRQRGNQGRRYRGVLSTSVHSDTHAAVLRAEVAVLLAKDAIESGGLRPILDLRALNRSLLRLLFKMLTTKRMLTCIRHQDWFAAIDLKDAYFHVSILPRHRPFLRFAFEGRAYQHKVLPFGLSLSPRVFTKVAEAALSPLWQMGIHILNYLDDWLLIAHSRDVLCEHRDLVLRHLSHLGLQVNREKSKLSPVQRISFLGVELDSVNMTARLTNERAQSVLNCLNLFRDKTAVPLKTFQRLLGHMAAAATVTPLGLLHMRPLQHWLHDHTRPPSAPVESDVAEIAQTLCKIREDEEQVLLVAPEGEERRRDLLSQGMGTIWHPRPDLWNLHAVIDTITQSRAPSTRQAYALRWGLFVDWCSSRGEDPQRCPIAVVLSFLQEKLERRLSPSTLKVYVAAIAAYHDAVDGASLGKHQLVVRFLRGARRVNPPRPHLVPSWDLAVTLQGLREAPFEPLASVELKYLSLKTALLTALASIKRVGDLQAFSVDEACLEFGPGDSHVILRPRPGYVPFRDQVVNLQALPLEEADPAFALLCPVRALRMYVDHTRHFRRTEQLFVCFGGQQKGNAVSKQRLAHWVVNAISLSYQNQGEPCPLGVHAHSTRSVASSYALAHGASLADICRAAGWATPNTFARFYNLRVEAVSSRVLT